MQGHHYLYLIDVSNKAENTQQMLRLTHHTSPAVPTVGDDVMTQLSDATGL